jgi:hypothetical protein
LVYITEAALSKPLQHQRWPLSASSSTALPSFPDEFSLRRGTSCHLTLKLSHTLRKELASGSPAMQQSLGQFLGSLDYTLFSHDLDNTVHALLGFVRPVRKII